MNHTQTYFPPADLQVLLRDTARKVALDAAFDFARVRGNFVTNDALQAAVDARLPVAIEAGLAASRAAYNAIMRDGQSVYAAEWVASAAFYDHVRSCGMGAAGTRGEVA